jgi:hypothetical protein
MSVTTSRRARKWLKVDALNRAWRTVLQGIVAAALTAAGDVVLQAIQKSFFEHTSLNWSSVLKSAAAVAATTALMAVLAYLHRTVVDPSAIPSGQPPAPPTGSAPATTAPPANAAP